MEIIGKQNMPTDSGICPIYFSCFSPSFFFSSTFILNKRDLHFIQVTYGVVNHNWLQQEQRLPIITES